MKRIRLYKFVAAGNDFLLFNSNSPNLRLYRSIARNCCRRHYALGADGLLVVEGRTNKLKMRIFNPDGSEAEMCGNGARCAALWAYLYQQRRTTNINFLTKAGEIKAIVTNAKSLCHKCASYRADIKLKMTNPTDIRINFSLPLASRRLTLGFVNTGVPHAVIFVENLENIDVNYLGRLIRNHKYFAPAGTNVDFVEFVNEDLIKIRTYERGVEKETLACGTGIVASAILYKLRNLEGDKKNRVKVLSRSGEILEVSFEYKNNNVFGVWLKGRASLVGEVLV